MHQCTLLALAFGLAVAISPAFSCERHQSHANLTTASTEPAPLPPQPVAKPALKRSARHCDLRKAGPVDDQLFCKSVLRLSAYARQGTDCLSDRLN